jgi:ATP-dependent DNA helicase RecG
VADLLLHVPFRYEDRSAFSSIAGLLPGQAATISGKIAGSRLIRTRRRGFSILEAAIDDESGTMRVLWYNRPYLAKSLEPGRRAILYGSAELDRGRLVFKNPEYELLDDAEERDPAHAGRVVGIYRRLAGLSGKWQRGWIAKILPALDLGREPRSPERVVAQALAQIHFPEGAHYLAVAEKARKILAREELLLFCDEIEERKARRRKRGVAAWSWSRETSKRILSVFPFELTRSQKAAAAEIAEDFKSGHPMARLLQGDVGSGKTAVALLAALLAAENGKQAALMAPTEILAEQHAERIGRWLAGTKYRLALLTGQTRPASRKPLTAALRAGEIDLLIGTHALIEEPVEFKDLGLAIIDEQHRFGVSHRARLTRKGGFPHVLVLSATPIPRSLAWTLYGDLEVSRLTEKPPGRGEVKTYVRTGESREKVLDFLSKRLAAGERAYVVVPAIEDSKVDIAAAGKSLELIRNSIPEARAEMLHGKMKSEDRRRVMADFAAGRVNVLVATTVIEVGIDVPEATVMLVENAERFGLAQLHQLRGRIGRGLRPSHCVFLSSPGAPPEALERLSVLAKTSDGFAIAEKDLELRGPGDLFGERQSGIPAFRVADPIRDVAILRDAREEVRRRRLEGIPVESRLFSRESRAATE